MIGLMGAILGCYAFPAILIGLFFQAVLFQHGGLTTLGINASVMGISALLAHHIFQARNLFAWDGKIKLYVFGFIAGAFGTGIAAVVMFVILFNTIPAHLDVAAEKAGIYALTLAHVP
nr:energy-coupling factor ABC transporter permease [Desulforamulus aquiferis]